MDQERVTRGLGNIPEPSELIRRAAALKPALIARAAQCEADRKVPAESVHEILAAGLFNVCKPAIHGGYDLGWDVLCDLTMELASACGSTGWVFGVCAEHAALTGGWTEQTQEEIWSGGPDTLISSSMMQGGDVREVDGGFRVTGTSRYSSGSDYADWFVVGELGVGGIKRGFVVPRDDVTLLNTWDVMGLCGTGTQDLELDDVFVPVHRASGRQMAPPPRDCSPLSRPQSFGPYSLASVCVGIARGFVDDFVAEMRERRSRFGAAIGEFQSLQLRIAESAAEVDAAQRAIRENLAETMSYVFDYQAIPPEIMMRNRRDMSYAPQLALRAVNRLMYAAGAGALFKGNPLERRFRDLRAGVVQGALQWDTQATQYGRWALGLEP